LTLKTSNLANRVGFNLGVGLICQVWIFGGVGDGVGMRLELPLLKVCSGPKVERIQAEKALIFFAFSLCELRDKLHQKWNTVEVQPR